MGGIVIAASGGHVQGVEELDFYRDVYPALKANCVSCHNKTTTKAGLNMETPALMKQGGDSGPGIVPGNAEESLVVLASLHRDDMEMPPANNKSGAMKLSAAEVAALKAWIEQGAKDSVREERQVAWQSPAASVDPIYSVAMTSDGRYAACGRSNRVFIHDLASRQFVAEPGDPGLPDGAAHRAMVQSLAFSADGERLATGSYREVKVWRKNHDSAVVRAVPSGAASSAAALSADGETLVRVKPNAHFVIQRVAAGATIREFAIDGFTKISALSISPDATMAAWIVDDARCEIWSLTDGKRISSLVGEKRPDPALEKQGKEAGDRLIQCRKTESDANAAWKQNCDELTVAKKALTDAEAAATPSAEIVAASKDRTAALEKQAAAAHESAKTDVSAREAAEKNLASAEARIRASQNVKPTSLTWMRDGQTLVWVGNDQVVRVCRREVGKDAQFSVVTTCKAPSGPVALMVPAVAADQLLLATPAGKVDLCNIQTGQLLKQWTVPSLTSMALSADGAKWILGGTDGVVRVWDVATSKVQTELRGSLDAIRKAAAQEWTVAAQGLEQAFQKAEIARIETQNKALDELLKKSNEAIVSMVKALPEKQKAVGPAQEAKTAAQQAVDEIVAAIAKAGETPDDALLKKRKDAEEKLQGATTKEESALAAVAATESNIKDAETEVQRITEAKAKNAEGLTAANAAIQTAKSLQDKASADLVAVRQAAAKPAAILDVAYAADSRHAAAISADGSVRRWALASGLLIEQLQGPESKAASLRFTSAGRVVSNVAEGSVILGESTTRWKLERVFGGDASNPLLVDRVNAVRFSPVGTLLATGGGDPSRSGDIVVFKVATGEVAHVWKDKHDDSVLSLDFSRDGRLLASGAADKLARVTDLTTGQVFQTFEGHTHHVMGVSFRADGRVLASAGADGVVISWDMLSGERKKKVEGWTKEVTSLQFIGATNQIVTSAGDNLVRIISDEGVQVRSIANLPDFMQSAASTPNGSLLIGGGEDSILRVWDGTNGKELAQFEDPRPHPPRTARPQASR